MYFYRPQRSCEGYGYGVGIPACTDTDPFRERRLLLRTVHILLECILVIRYIYYRPQRSWAKVIFSQACVKNSVHRGGGCLPQCMLGYPPPDQAHPPPRPGPPGTRHTPPGPGTPPLDQAPPRETRHPPDQAPPWETRHPPGRPGTPPGSRLQHTVNERPVRILLECIIV